MIKRMKRLTPAKLVVLLAVVALAASACQPTQPATMTLTHVTVDVSQDASDSGSSIDEVQVRTIAWSTKPGQAGSTTAEVISGNSVFIPSVAEGETHDVAAANGVSTFDVSPLTLDNFNAGQSAEVIGAVTIVAEFDSGTVSEWNSIADAAAAELQSRVAAEFEPLTSNTGSTIGHVNQLNAALEVAFDGYEDDVEDEFRSVFPAGVNFDNDYFFTANQARVVVDNQLSAVFSGFGDVSYFNSKQSWTGGTLDAGTESYDFVVFGPDGSSWTLAWEITL